MHHQEFNKLPVGANYYSKFKTHQFTFDIIHFDFDSMYIWIVDIQFFFNKIHASKITDIQTKSIFLILTFTL